MNNRDYYSVRTGKVGPNPEIDLKVLKKLFILAYDKLEKEGYFQKYFGFDCVDQGFVAGELGDDLETTFFFNLKKENLFPVREKYNDYSEDDLFDVLEFLHDHCSNPTKGFYHGWLECGYHYTEFDDTEGKHYYRSLINPMLNNYGNGFEISSDGEILILADTGLSNLFDADVPTNDKDNISIKIDRAILKFRRHRSTIDERQDAIRDLVDVLEYLRPEAKNYLDKSDESDLFNIANNFGIRHHNEKQKNKYDKAVWHSWMFYHYLATIHALLRIIEKNKPKTQSLPL